MVLFESASMSTSEAAVIWQLWADVSRWAEADHILAARIDGPFAVGSTIHSQAKGLPASKLLITLVDEPRLWIDEARSPGLRMVSSTN